MLLLDMAAIIRLVQVGAGQGAQQGAGDGRKRLRLLDPRRLARGCPQEGEVVRDQWIVMKGREVFKEATTRMSAAANEVLAQAGVSVEDVALVVPHQANLRIIQATGKALGVREEKVYVNVQEYGNTGSASVPLALWEARRQGRIAPGDLVLLTSFGAGFHWAAMLLRF